MSLLPEKYFCPDCLVEMVDDFEWDDCPTHRCPKCGSHCEDTEPIEATKISQQEMAKKRKEFIRCVKDTLASDDGLHFYIPLHNDVIHPLQYSRGPWITGEAEEEDGHVYVCAYLTTRVDTLGYCYGEVISDAYPDKDYSDDSIGDAFDFLVCGLDEYGCIDGVLQSHPRQLQRGRVKDGQVY